MSDWPGGRVATADAAPKGILSTYDTNSVGGYLAGSGLGSAGAVWPVANTALYVPVIVSETMTAYQMAVEITTQSGNIDVGIYDESQTRLVSMGSTSVAGAGVQVFDIADTLLTPGVYFLGLAIDNTTAAVRRVAAGIVALRCCGMAQQATAFPLPSPATFAVVSLSSVPAISVALKAVAL